MKWNTKLLRVPGFARRGSKAIGLGLLAAAFAGDALAQVAGYSFSKVAGTYTEITGGLLLNSTTTTTVAYVDGTANFTNSANGAPNNTAKGVGYPIGFNFTFNGLLFDRVGLSSQGWISFGNSANGTDAVHAHGGFGTTPPLSYNVGLSPVTAPERYNRVSAGISLLVPRNAAPLGELRIQTIGSSPNRTCVVQWKNFRTGTSTDAISFQIRLNEVDNSVEIIYQDPATQWFAASALVAQIGLRGTGHNPTDFNRLTTPQIAGKYDWNAITNATVNTTAVAANCYIGGPTPVSQPAAGTTLRWVPPTCWIPTNPQFVTAEDDAAVLAWTNSPGAGVYEYAVNTTQSPTAGSPITGGSSASAPMRAPGLTGNTQYYAYVRKNCGAGDYSPWALVPNKAISLPGNQLVANAFTTAAGCGQAFNRTYDNVGGAGPVESRWTFCPDNAGDVAQVTFSKFNVAPTANAVFVYDGATITAPLISSGQPAGTTPANLPGGFSGSNIPGPFISSQAGSCLTFRYLGGSSADTLYAQVTCQAAPTCFPPSNVTITPGSPAVAVSLTSAAAAIQYRIVAGGAPVSAAALVTNIVSSWPFSVNSPNLLGSTNYTMYLRNICAPGDTSAWGLGSNFKTKFGCGGPMVLFPGGQFGGAGYPINTDSVITLCPNSVGDVVTLTHTMFSIAHSQGSVGYFVHDGPNTAAPLINSGLQATSSGTSYLPAGGFYGPSFRFDPSGGAPANVPGPFTSSHPSGCLTVHFRAGNTIGNFDRGVEANITCGPPAACARPHAVSVAGTSQTGTTVSWSGSGSGYIVEYGPVGFTPGTGASAGGGTIIANATSPQSIAGLTATTGYDVYVRRVCAGPSYSANSYRVRFATSMDCSTAQVVSCGEMVNAPFVSGVSGNPVYQGAYYANAACMARNVSSFVTQNGNGAERLYRFTAPETGSYQLNLPISTLAGSQYTTFATQPVSSGCAAAGFTCVGVSTTGSVPTTGTQTASQHTFSLTAGDHYIIVDGLNSINGSQPFEILCPGLPSCIAQPTFPANGQAFGIYSTPITFSWPARFGATGYNVYFMGDLVSANQPGTTFTGAAYAPGVLANDYGVGEELTWRAVPVNAEGEAIGCNEWTFYVEGGNTGITNPAAILPGVPKLANNLPGYGFTASNYNTTGNTGPGVDVTYAYTASACAQSVTISLCAVKEPSQSSTPATRLFLVGSDFSTTPVAQTSATPSPAVCGNAFDRRLVNIAVTPGQSYYIVVDGGGFFLQNQFTYTITLTETLNPTDTDGDGLANCADNCPAFPGVEGDPCEVGPLFEYGEIIDCQCQGVNPVPCSNLLTLEFQTDGFPSQTTWELVEQGTNFVTKTGGPLPAPNGVMTMNTCLPDGCFYLRVLDSAGDGMTSGGYILRTQGTNLRIIDNRNNFSSGSVSAISGNQGFCLPIGTDRTIFTSCDKLDWVTGKFIVASANAAVSGQFGVTNSTSGYEFWFFDPNGSYSFRRFRNHATSDGTGTGATRACHFKINGWTNTVSTPHLPANTLLNVRVRGRVAGSNLEFGPACLFKIDAALAACPRVSLQDNPADADYSCGVSRTFGGANSASNKLVAAAPQIIPAVASTNIRYQFRFRIPGEYPAAGSCIVRPIQTSPTLYLNWTSGERLKCNTQYDVDMRVSKDGGATWCVANGAATCDSPASIQLWGKVCKVNITSSTFCPVNGQGGASNLAVENTGDLTMYPNPNRGDQLFINLNVVEKGVNTVSVDIFDLTGKKVTARTIAVQDGTVKTALELSGDLSNGMYLVNITAGSKAYTERLVIQH